MTKSLKLKIYGSVQGVGFRWMIQNKANNLNLVGYVKNNFDKTVTVKIQGEGENLDLFISWLEDNPSPAQIDKIEKSERTVNKSYRDFQIKF